jgi:hypothetical protein
MLAGTVYHQRRVIQPRCLLGELLEMCEASPAQAPLMSLPNQPGRPAQFLGQSPARLPQVETIRISAGVSRRRNLARTR